MKRLKIAALSVAGVLAAVLAVDYVAVQSKERRLSAAVSACGGKIGSIPAWPIGTEYRITFNHVLDEKQLQQMEIANHMRGWVGIAFRDVELSNEERTKTSAVLNKCHLFMIRDDQFVLLNKRHSP
jgi:hypothetical protein